MNTKRRKDLQTKLLIACYTSSMVGTLGVVAFFFAAFNLTGMHIRQIFWPAFVMLAADAYLQYAINERLLSHFFKWLEKEDAESDIELTRAAQIEMLNFPPRGSGASMLLWFVSASVVAIFVYITGSAFSPRHLITMVIAIGSGGPLSMLFQYSFYKRIFRRECVDLLSAQTGLHREQTTTAFNIRTKWLIGVLVIITVGMVYAGFMGNNSAATALQQRFAQIIKKTGQQAISMESAQQPSESITEFLERVSAETDQRVFIFDDQGNIVYGNPPSDLNPDSIREFLADYRGFIARNFKDQEIKTRNILGSSNEFLWIPLGQNRNIGSVFYRGIANNVLGSFNRNFVLMAIFFIVIAFFVAYLAATDISVPMSRMLDLSDRISTGDLTENVNMLSEDEVGRLAAGLQKMIEELRGMISRVSVAAEQVDRASFDIQESQSMVSDGTREQVSSIEESSHIAGELTNIVNDISENVEVMADSARESAKVIMGMEGLANELNENARELSSAVETTSSAIYEMNASVRDINDGVEVLTRVAEETASSTLEMDQAIKEVEGHARETLMLSEQVTDDSTKGVVSVQSTISGIGRIEEGVREASEVITNLGRHAEEIGQIVNVITDIADQTNLLALNAAIIAAQAGERGRSFAVVADEIKKLSDRTTISTKEIRNLIASVQSETQRAVSVMDAEAQSVEEGVNLAFQAGQALEKIQKSAQRSADMANRIAAATTQQAATSRRVTEAVSAIAERVSHIAAAIREQTRGTEQITSATSEMREISPMVKMKAQKQAEGGKQITMAMGNITEMVNYVLKSQQKQQEQSERIMMAMGKIRNILKASTETVTKLDTTVNALSRQSDILRKEVGHFKLPKTK